ncbi:MAG: hypothetical protein K8F30_10035 [Taibaiella sp.]|nr:hypothetical protein [Taibaiella sp.]
MAFLKRWKEDIDDRLFNEGYEMREGVLYERNGTLPIDVETYRKRRNNRGR